MQIDAEIAPCAPAVGDEDAQLAARVSLALGKMTAMIPFVPIVGAVVPCSSPTAVEVSDEEFIDETPMKKLR